jgi:UDP-N-acetylglucosamine diphosphorylase / glucose-1-phosphate thymidylyltransferase / UDP-N-acetylgalactosamine diphosphorylase / glucosamine-1-phosphate N-acetyltransferase / galactosamine-1-phosphate N-acetyltransferase
MELKDISYYVDLSEFKHKTLFEGNEYVFDFLKKLGDYIQQNLKPEILGEVMDGAHLGDNVFLGKGSVVQPGAWVHGPAIIGENCQIRHGAYVGANTLTGDNVVIGHASEVGNSVFLNNACAPHFAFVGHTLLGNKVNLGAGTKISNLKVTFKEIEIDGVKTGLSKIGAIIGDNSSLGCNTVTQPASFLGKNVFGYPLAQIRGFVESNTIVKVRQTQESVKFDPNR